MSDLIVSDIGNVVSTNNPYCTVAELKTSLGISDTDDDTLLTSIIAATSREIDNFTHRRFYPATQTRYYTPEFPDILYVDDLLSVTTLKTDEGGDGTYETTWATTDYHLEPFNAPLESQPQPYTVIRRANNGTRYFPARGQQWMTSSAGSFPMPGGPQRQTVYKGVEIVGSWGYSTSTPPVVNEACLIQGARLYRRKDAPFGVAGSGEFGQTLIIAKLDPDVKLLLEPVVKKRSV